MIKYSLEKAIIRMPIRFAKKRNYFKHVIILILIIQLKILMKENGHLKNTLNLLNHLLIMEKNGQLFRSVLVLEVVVK